MSWFRSRPDEVDAALTGADADADVVAIVETLRSAYLPEEPLTRSAALSAFCDASRPAAVVVPLAARGRGSAKARVSAAAAAFVATLAGKIVLGSAVAAAGLGGMHAAEVIDVPLLPDRAPVADEADLPEVPSWVPPVRSTDPADVVPPNAGPADGRVPTTATDRVGDAPFDRSPEREAPDGADASDRTDAPDGADAPDRTDASARGGEEPDRSSPPPAVPDETPASEPPADRDAPFAEQGEEQAPTEGSAPARADESGARAEGDGRAPAEEPAERDPVSP